MADELIRVKKDFFNEVGVDLYQNENGSIYMTIEQLAQALNYSSRKSIEKIIERNIYLKKQEFSVLHKLSAADGKLYSTRLFTEDGIYEITMLSKQPKAQKFRLFIHKLLKELKESEVVTQNKPQNNFTYTTEGAIFQAEQWIQEQKRKISIKL